MLKLRISIQFDIYKYINQKKFIFNNNKLKCFKSYV